MLVRRGELDRAERLLIRAERMLPLAEQPTAPDVQPLAGGDHGLAIAGVVRSTLAVARGDLSTAEAALARAYPAAVTSQDMPILALVAVGAAELADARGRHRDAALLLGAAARLRGAEDRTDPLVAELTRRSQLALGGTAFTAAYAAGWSLDAQAAVARVNPSRDRHPALTIAPDGDATAKTGAVPAAGQVRRA
jgi:hypothetical protein